MSITPLDDKSFTRACYPSEVTSIISLDDRTFASACISGKIKIWKFQDTFSIACEKTIDEYEDKIRVILTPLSKHYILSYLYGIGQEFKLFDYELTGLSDEFKLWDVKTFELLKTFKNNSNIEILIALKDNSIVIYSEDDEVSLWQISE